MRDLIGRTLGHYRVVEKIGEGGMGEVYRAHDERLERNVAIKVIHEAVAQDADRLARFEREAKAVAKLDHPNILEIFDFDAEGDVTYAVTELLEGKTLREHLQESGGPAQGKRVQQIGAAVADGLGAAHDKGVVHRDIKPSNIFLCSDGRVKILDFGLAATHEVVDSETETASIEAPLTRQGVVMGTVGFMAPEQVRGLPADHRSDIFALGCVLYEMLSGKRTFSGETDADVLAAILRKAPRSLTESEPGLPAALCEIVERCLEKSPQQRFQSARDLAFALRSVPASAPPARSETIGEKPHRADDRPSVAVLPFANLSADSEQEFFCDGMAEEIINALAQVQRLRVVARTSAFAFKGKLEDVREIGSRLDVGAIVEGSVRKAGDRLRITAQLIDVRDGSHLWSERFDRRLEGVFEIQDEIALAVVDNLKVRLLAREKASLAHRHTNNLEAHNAYLVGLFEWNKMSPDGFVRCQELFHEAIRLDPEFAPPYAQLADSFTSVTWWADQPPAEALAKALPLVEKALTLDPGLAHAHSVLGQYRSFFLRDWVAGERSMRRAVELAPNDALAQTYLALLLMMAERGTEASERARIALRLDPLSPTSNVWAGVVLLISGDADEGLSVIERQAAMTPNLWMPSYWLSVGLANGERFAEAKVAGENALELSGGSSLTQCNLALMCYRLGEKQAGDLLFAALQQRAHEGYLSPMFLAWLHLARGEPVDALRRVEEALAAKDPWVNSYRVMYPTIVPADPLVDDLIACALP
jgi:serine/threonine protein kinase/tetratricopeptide (TPR) repeat protein